MSSNAVDSALPGEPASELTLYMCLTHNEPDVEHNTEQCRQFTGLLVDDRYALLKQHHACFRCFGEHPRRSCASKSKCVTCGKITIILCCVEKEKVVQITTQR